MVRQEDLMGKLVLIPTLHRSMKDAPSMMSGFSVIIMKGIKRKSLDLGSEK